MKATLRRHIDTDRTNARLRAAMPTPSDRELFAKFKAAGSHDVFAEIVARHTDLVYSACLRILGDPAEADDATQATFLVLLRKGRTLADDTVLASWLFKVAEFAARNALRARYRRAAHEREAPMPQHHEAHWDDLKPYLDAALATLPDVQRDAVVLRYMRGLSRTDVAREMRCPEKTVQTRLSRAMESLRGFLQRRGVIAPMAVLATMITANSVQAAPVGMSAAIASNCLAAGGTSAAVLGLAEMTAKSLAWAKAKALATAAAIVLAIGGPLAYIAASQIASMLSKPAPSAPAIVTPVTATPKGDQRQIDGRFVSPRGTPAGDGSRESPWDLETALAQPEALKAGQTLWLDGGTYAGNFISKIAGTEQEPIIVRAMPGERVIFRAKDPANNVLTIQGAYTWFWGFEVINPGARVSKTEGSWPQDIPYGGAINSDKAQDIKLINLVVHDNVGGGASLWENCTNAEVYGCVIYNNGWEGTDRGHGPGLSVQNRNGQKSFSDNIIFQNYSDGVLAYGSSKAVVRDVKFEGNIFFHNGAWAKSGGIDFILGGGAPSEKVSFLKNVVCSPGDTCLDLGYNDSINKDCIATDNAIIGGVRLQRWQSLSFANNTIVGMDSAVQLSLEKDDSFKTHQFRNNRYFIEQKQWPPFTTLAPGGNAAMNFDEWRAKTKLDATSSFSTALPKESQVFVRANRYEPGRAHIAVCNWTQKKNVTIDVTGFLKPGTRYEVKSVFDLFGKPVWEGTCEGTSISFPLLPIRAPIPNGAAVDPPPLDPQFQVFVLVPKAK